MTYEELLKEIKNNAEILGEEEWFEEEDNDKIEKAMKAVIKDYIREYYAPYHYDFVGIVEKYLEFDNLKERDKDISDFIEENRKRFIKDFEAVYPHFEENKIYDVIYNWIVGNVKEKRYSLEERLREYLSNRV